jgi:hypothetical protein
MSAIELIFTSLPMEYLYIALSGQAPIASSEVFFTIYKIKFSNDITICMLESFYECS